MRRNLLTAGLVGLVLLFGLTSTREAAALGKQQGEPVTIVLRNGDKIGAKILDIWRDKIVFKANSWQDAYNYGEVISIGEVVAIELKDGRRMSVGEYDDYRNGRIVQTKQEEPAAPQETQVSDRVIVARSPESPTPTSEQGELDQYELLKRKPIAEMTDREFEFFMMMKKRELEEQRAQEQFELQKAEQTPPASEQETDVGSLEPVREDEARTAPPATEEIQRLPGSSETEASSPAGRRFGLRLPPLSPGTSESGGAEETARLLIEADLAGPFLKYVSVRRGQPLTPFQQKLVQAVESSPEWQDRVDQVEYLSRVASKSLERVYVYEPESLKKDLGLVFDENADMDFSLLLRQLHGKLGNDVQMADFRILVNAIGESGARAIRDLLRSYDTFEYVKAAGGEVAGK